MYVSNFLMGTKAECYFFSKEKLIAYDSLRTEQRIWVETQLGMSRSVASTTTSPSPQALDTGQL